PRQGRREKEGRAEEVRREEVLTGGTMKRIILAACVGLVMSGCASMGIGVGGPTAVADLEPTKGNAAKGKVTFAQDGDSVRVSANVSGLKPGAQHGFHVHEKGDCSSGDGMSTGGHFNPDGKHHGPRGGADNDGDIPALVA